MSRTTKTPPVKNSDLLTFNEAMAYLKVSRSTLYRLMWFDGLPGHKVGAGWRFYKEDLNKCIR